MVINQVEKLYQTTKFAYTKIDILQFVEVE